MTTDPVRSFTVVHGRDAGGRFTSANNPGRPKGAKGKARGTLEKIRSFGPEALEALHQAIIAKERWAIEFCLNKIIPSNSRAIEFEDLTTDDVREAFKNGDISTSELKEIVTSLEKMANIEEWDVIRERLDKLEQAANAAR
ncbi:hypothetical protein [Aquamicrobium defluvii]|uniref:hypothetical protein n=1 Tax=Aquamicrobium defluvii TaxID=69279 RepID=UPI00105E5CD8|nr:hypothetical protein [Aquamicrobium defluvii]